MTPPVTVDDFKARFNRDFPYGTDPSSAVADADITNALNDATLIFNTALWDTGVELNTAFLMLAAHFLALNIQAVGGLGLSLGLENSGGSAISSQTVGSVSLSFELPEGWKNDPTVAPFLRTSYGIRYVQMAWPRMRGNFQTVAGFNDTGLPSA